MARPKNTNTDEASSVPVELIDEAAKTSDDLVVALVRETYSVPLEEGGFKKYPAGDQVMPRTHAEHWFSKSRGVKIIGVPDVHSFRSSLAQSNLKLLIASFDTSSRLARSLTELTDLNDAQKSALDDLIDLTSKIEMLGTTVEALFNGDSDAA